jgi:peptide chain release factor 1
VVGLLSELEAGRLEARELESLAADKDPEMASMAKEDLGRVRQAVEEKERRLLRCLLPRDEADERGVVLEVRAGTGGDEASLFTAEMFAMYEKFAAANGWRFELLTLSRNEIGGLKEASASIQGQSAYQKLKVRVLRWVGEGSLGF